jgi:hypothetical protein
MKKTIIAIAAVMFLASCGGSDSKPVEATHSDTPGVDYSITLPPLTDSAKVDSTKNNDSTLNGHHIYNEK